MSRRIVTAREQVGLLAPWRTAAEDARWVGPLNTPDSDQGGTPGKQRIKYPEATQRVIDDVHAATGVKLDVENTGGNTYVLSGRCHEDGSWLVVGDHTDGDIWWDLAHRHREEAEGGPKGWYAAVYRNQVGEDGSEHWGFDPQKGHSTEPYHIHEDEHGTVHDLPRVVSETLATMPRGQMPTGNPATPERDDLDDDYGDIFGKQSMRRVAAVFDWRRSPEYDAPGISADHHSAPLENGDRLHAYRVNTDAINPWLFEIEPHDMPPRLPLVFHDGVNHDLPRKPIPMTIARNPAVDPPGTDRKRRNFSGWGRQMDDGTWENGTFHTSLSDAMDAVERRYLEEAPKWGSREPHGRGGFDYDGFFDPGHGGGDDDYGDIFGEGK